MRYNDENKRNLAIDFSLQVQNQENTTMYQDEKLVCEDCGAEFVFTAGEQEFYAEKGLVNKPKRCPECRKNRRQNNRRHAKKMYDAVCSKCGAQTQVPFKPIPGKEVYCKECFASIKAE